MEGIDKLTLLSKTLYNERILAQRKEIELLKKIEKVHLVLEGNETFMYLIPENHPEWKKFKEKLKGGIPLEYTFWNHLFDRLSGVWIKFQVPYGETINRQVEIIDTIMFY